MLILTRRQAESFMIGDDITVAVLAVNGSQVRLGIKAPRAVPVHREEIFRRIEAERMSSQVKSDAGKSSA